MSKYGKVSIVMPSYNTGSFIAESILSVLAQTYEDWELIIVDDCSTDDTAQVAQSFSNPKIRYLKNESNSGAALSRNRALREATGDWIAFLDSDDLWFPEKLDRQLDYMVSNGYGFTGTAMCEIDEEGNLLRRVGGPKRLSRLGMHVYCWPSCLTVMYRISEVGLVQIENLQKNNDYGIWLKVIEKTDYHFLDEELALYRRRNGSISNAPLPELVKSHYNLYRTGQGYSIPASSCLTALNMVGGVIKKTIYTRDI